MDKSDWAAFRAAVFMLLHGGNPYHLSGHFFFNPVWTLAILAPLLLLPPYAGYGLNALAGFATFIPITRKLRIGVWGYFFIVTSGMFIGMLVWGNIDWLPWVGLLVPSEFSFLLFLVKPQETIGLMLWLLIRAQLRGGYAAVSRLLILPAALLLGQVAIYGIPPVPLANNPGNSNSGLFPYSLLIAAPLLVYSLIAGRSKAASASGPFMAPYAGLHSYLSVMFMGNDWARAGVWVLSYVPILVNAHELHYWPFA